jgi:hypothetical protein
MKRHGDEDLREQFVLSSLRAAEVPSKRIHDDFDRSNFRKTRTARWRRRVTWAAASAVAIVGVVIPVVLLAPLGDTPRSTTPGVDAATADVEGSSVEMSGIRLALPAGWDGQVYLIPGYTRPILRAGSFPLPEVDDAAGSVARSLMSEDDVLLGMTEYETSCPCPGFDPAALPISFGTADFASAFDGWSKLQPQPNAVPATHAFARRTFVVKHRVFDLWLEFASKPAPDGDVAATNSILDSLRVGAFEPPAQPDGACTSWLLGVGSKDPDCPETPWLRSVLTSSGFDVVDLQEESSLVGQSEDSLFNIWVRPPEFPFEGVRFFETVAGVDLHGFGRTEYLVWRVQGQVVSIASFSKEDASLPTGQELEELVQATIDTTFEPSGS